MFAYEIPAAGIETALKVDSRAKASNAYFWSAAGYRRDTDDC